VQAAYITRTGPASSIRIGELETPQPGPDELLVATERVVVNPVDTHVRGGRFQTRMAFPFVVGRDLVGTVAASGPATGWSVGDRVWCNSLGHDGRQGSFAQYAVVPVERCYPLPAGVDPSAMVAVVHPAATAYLAWFVHARLLPTETVFVGGAGGNVGSAAVCLAHHAGARVLASASPADHQRVRDAGADAVFDYHDQTLGDRLREAVPQGVDVFWDTSGHHDFELVGAVTALRARVMVTAAAVARSQLSVADLYRRDVSLHGFTMSRATVTELAAAAATINTLMAGGVLTARVAEQLPLSATADAHARLERGEVHGRLVLSPM